MTARYSPASMSVLRSTTSLFVNRGGMEKRTRWAPISAVQGLRNRLRNPSVAR